MLTRYCGDHFEIYTNSQSLCRLPRTNTAGPWTTYCLTLQLHLNIFPPSKYTHSTENVFLFLMILIFFSPPYLTGIIQYIILSTPANPPSPPSAPPGKKSVRRAWREARKLTSFLNSLPLGHSPLIRSVSREGEEPVTTTGRMSRKQFPWGKGPTVGAAVSRPGTARPSVKCFSTVKAFCLCLTTAGPRTSGHLSLV